MNKKMHINGKLIAIGIIFMFVFMAASLFLINIVFNNGITLTANVHLDQITEQLETDIELLQSTTEKIAQNDKIVKILDENRSFEQLDEEEKSIIMEQINLYEQNLKATNLVETVNLISLSGDYLFSKGNTYENFKLSDRPWFKEEYLNLDKTTFLTEIHEDFTTKKETIGIVSFIYSKDNKELLGAAISDIFIDELVNKMESSFHIASLEAIVTLNTYDLESLIGENKDKYYTKYAEEILPIIKNEDKYYIKYAEEILSNGNGILFLVDKDSASDYYLVKSSMAITRTIVVIIAIIVSISLIISIRISFRPAIQSIDKLKNLMSTLGDDVDIDSLDKMDEFKQLEAISTGIGKSFDNKIQSLIYYDALTGLGNRKRLYLVCGELIDNKEEFALVFIDLNKFKKVNDVFGHNVGDKLLVTFANIIKEVLGDKGELIRYSGDEFIIVYKQYKNDSDFVDFYEKNVVPKFNERIEIEEGIKLSIEFSVGIAIYPRDGASLDDLINKSDFMMYTSKANNEPYRLLFFNDDIYKDMIYVENLKNQLKNSIANNELSLNYQPIFNEDKSIVKAEALLRWNSKVLGQVNPQQFISYAEETREIIPIGYWIVEKVCKFINENKLKMEIGINISPIQLLEVDFVENINKILNEYNVSPNQIYFEITETVLLDENESVKNNILNLRKKGIAIALDDFGTGYASFNYLKKYNLDILKIDKLFIDNATSSEFEMVAHIKDISNLLNMKVVIEGVETEEQFNELKKIGCNFFQGYYLSRPLDENNFLNILKE